MRRVRPSLFPALPCPKPPPGLTGVRLSGVIPPPTYRRPLRGNPSCNSLVFASMGGRIKKPTRKPTKPRFYRYAVRIGRTPGIYRSYEHGAQEQVEGMPACHLGFTKRQVLHGLHHKYMQNTLADEQIRKLMAGDILLDATSSADAYHPRPYEYYDCDRAHSAEAGKPPAAAKPCAQSPPHKGDPPTSRRPTPRGAAQPAPRGASRRRATGEGREPPLQPRPDGA